MSQQETATDRLVSIIQSIQMAQQSGVLTVKRGEGGTLEEGSIVFVNGQMKQTTVGRRSGAEALNWLSTWGQCRYIFALSGAAEIRQTEQLNTGPSTNPGSVRPITRELGLGVRPSPAERQSGPLQPVYRSFEWERNTPLPIQPPIIFSPTLSLAQALRRIEQSKLSRSHRQLFLLIDGQRSAPELARLAGKNQQDLQALLQDLERIGVIRPGGD